MKFEFHLSTICHLIAFKSIQLTIPSRAVEHIQVSAKSSFCVTARSDVQVVNVSKIVRHAGTAVLHRRLCLLYRLYPH